MKKTLAVLVLLASAGLVSGCLVPASGSVRIEGPVVEYGYTPILFSGYVVYYADGGIPFIWMNGAQFWIPESDRGYYVAHYHQHSSAYHEWYRHRGDSYRGQRYTNHEYEGRRLQKADDRKRVTQPALQPADDRERRPAPALRPADERERVAQPVLHRAPEVQPQPKAEPEPKKAEPKLEVAPEPKKKPKLTKKDD